MALRVAIELVDPRRPDRAVASALTPVFGTLAPSRTLHALDLRWTDGPGTCAAPWTLAGIGAAAEAASLCIEWETLALGDEQPPRPHGVPTDLPGARRARTLPRRWFGRHLCLVVPCASLDPASNRAVGPVTAALQALDRHTGGPRRRESPRVAARMLATVFASVTVVVDGAWWADLSPASSAARSLVALDRCFVASVARPSAAWTRLLQQTFDPWLAHRLRLGGRGRGLEHAVRGSGPGEHATWPRAHATTPGRPRAGRALEALWRPTKAQRRLGPAVPGDLARLWSQWTGLRGGTP
ncbi:MAG: hypothetical protein AAGA54_02005 [Myxococcota bacterium]